MSTRDQNLTALLKTREFLSSLLNPKETPRVSKAIRNEASDCLKHYPFPCEIFMLDEIPNEKEDHQDTDRL